jgi:peptide deformylase
VALLPILTSDKPVLRGKAKKVAQIDKSIHRLIDDMIETLHDSHGVGLAAPQVGVPLRLAVIEIPADDEDEPMAGKLFVLINPEIVKSEGEIILDEACLSVPGYVGKIRRFEKVTVKALDRNGKSYRVKGDGLFGEALQHELDHLDGVLFFDHLVEHEALRAVKSVPEDEDL